MQSLQKSELFLQMFLLNKYRTEFGLQLRQAMFINGLLFNSEVWQGAGSSDIKCLENVDHQQMLVICNGRAKTPLEFMYMETAAHPLKYLIASSRIMYLHNILNKDDALYYYLTITAIILLHYNIGFTHPHIILPLHI